MPYFLKQVGKKYYVVDTTGKQYSKKPLPKARAERQMKALHINTGHGLCGGKLEETEKVLIDFLNELSTHVNFQLMPPKEKQRFLNTQFESILSEMRPLFDEEGEEAALIISGKNHIRNILTGTFPPDVQQQRRFQEELAQVAQKPTHVIIGATSGDTPVFRRQHIREHPSISGNTFNPHDFRNYYQQSDTNEPYPTEEDVQLPPTSREEMLNQLLKINQRTGEYYSELIKAGLTAALTPAQVKARNSAQSKGQGRYTKCCSEPDTHILIGDYLEGSGTGKWTALINALSRMYSIPKALVDSTIALNDRQSGQYRFNTKKQNILSQFSDYLNPTIVNEILELDESDPKSVSDYANTINGRSEMALNLRAVNTVNPLQVSVATSNPLSGRGRRKYKGGLSNALFDQIVSDASKKIYADPDQQNWLKYNQEMFNRMVSYLDTTQQEKKEQIINIINELMKQATFAVKKGIDNFFQENTWNLLKTLLGLEQAGAHEAFLGEQAGKAALESSARRQTNQQEVQAFVEPEEEQFQAQPQQQSERTSQAPQQARTGQGKLKFIKKYLRGQGLPATKKNVAKICNIMDVEGVVFE